MRPNTDFNSIMQEDVSETSLDNSSRLRVAAPPRQKWTLKQEAFDKLLLSLDSDRDSAGAIYQETRCKLARFFEWRGCPFPEDHADETINRVAKRISEGEDIRDLPKYFFGVARLLFLEIQKEGARELQALNNLPAAVSSSPDSRAQGLDCLRRCLESISSKQRDLIIGYYQGEKSAKIKNRQRLSERLQIPINTLRMRALRLRDKLEECVENCLNMVA
jgi:DNA-directed RNA polymerase specialized sigma24 family protein